MDPIVTARPALKARTGNVLLWASDPVLPANVAQALEGGFRVHVVPPGGSLADAAQDAQAALIYLAESTVDVRAASAVLDELDRGALVGLVLLPPGAQTMASLLRREGPFAVLRSDAPASAIAEQLAALIQIQPALRNLHRELAQVRTFGKDINTTFDQIDEEMRLAARLQRDFLPKSLPEVGPLRFGALFRPATWVSGDIYDVMRLDEDHLGLYVADAVGHGLPAALLTMFIKRALPTKRIQGQLYTLVQPDQAISALNDSICQQNLSSCQFCTAVYCMVDVRTLQLSYCRGGHPEPVILRADGGEEVLAEPGGLLGIFPEEQFRLGRAQLAPGDRVVVFSDGAEGVFRHDESLGRDELLAEIRRLRHLSTDEFILEIASVIDARQGSLHPEDDVTLLAMDVV